MGNLDFGVLSIFKYAEFNYESHISVSRLYSVANFSAFKIKICYHDRKNN